MDEIFFTDGPEDDVSESLDASPAPLTGDAGEPETQPRTGDATEPNEEAEFLASDEAESDEGAVDPAGKAVGSGSAQEPDMDACIEEIREADGRLRAIKSNALKKYRALKAEIDRVNEEYNKASALLALAKAKSASTAAAEMEMDPKTVRLWARRFHNGRKKGLGPKDCLALDGRRRPTKDSEAAKIVEAALGGEGGEPEPPLVERAASWLNQAVEESRNRPEFPDWRLYPLAEIHRSFFTEYEGHGEDVEMRGASAATVRRAIKKTKWGYPIQRNNLLRLCEFRGCAPEEYKVPRWWRSGPEVQEAIKEARKRAYEAKASAVPKTLLKPASVEVVPEPASGESSAPFEESPLDKAVDPAVEAPGDTASASASAEPAPEGGAES